MELERIISRKGQIVIPKDIRKHLGLKPGSEVIFDIENGVAIIRPKKSGRELVEEFCNIPIKRKLKGLTPAKLKRIFEGEYEIS